MPTTLRTTRTELTGICAALRTWQCEGGPVQLHPGDVGWLWRYGTSTVAEALRVWHRDGQPVAVGMLDGPTLLRLAVAPEAVRDDEVARVVLADLGEPDRGVLAAGAVAVEARGWESLDDRLAAAGWQAGEPWTPLRRELAGEVDVPDVRIEVVTPELAADRTAVHRAAFGSAAFTEPRWREMAAGPLYADARCLLAFDGAAAPVAAITVWSAGEGRPGLIEPMGTHPEHRGRGYGHAITLAGARTLRALGASSATVCTPSDNAAGVAAYASAGFTRLPESRDRARS